LTGFYHLISIVGVPEMKTLRMVVIGAFTLTCAQAFAQDASTAPQSSDTAGQGSAALAVGGVPSTTGEMGAPMGKTRDQVYQDLVQSQHTSQAARLQELYKGGN
jgi:hypothetical protein